MSKRIYEASLENENERLKEMIRELPCYGDWCGKSPSKNDPGLCLACEAQKKLEKDHD